MGWRYGMALTMLVTSVAGAQSNATGAAAAAWSQDARAMLQDAYPADGPGVSAVVWRDGRIVFADARGLGDLEHLRPLTPDTPVRIGSVTKQFTAASVLQLVAEHRLSLDDPLSRFFPDWPPPGSAATIRQLLNHSSGLQDFTKAPGFMGSPPTLTPWSTAELIDLISRTPAKTAPGADWEYNNAGYIVLGAIIEQVTQRPWHVAVTERIGRPLKLASLHYALDPPIGAARGYSRDGNGFAPARGVHISMAHAAGGLVASAGDLARWAAALHGGRVVTPALYEEMVAPARLSDSTSEPYGFGLRLGALLGRRALVHGGAGRGLDAETLYLPDARLFVAVLANTDAPTTDPSVLARRLAAMALGRPFPKLAVAAADPRSLQPLLGEYRAERGPSLNFFADGDALYLKRGEAERRVFAAGEDRFFFGAGALAWFRIVKEGGGKPVIELHSPEEAAPIRAVRVRAAVAPLTLPLEVARTYVGRYKTETVTLAVVLDADGRIAAGPIGQPGQTLRPVSTTEFRLGDTPMRLVFHPENGKVDRLTLHRGARELHGARIE